MARVRHISDKTGRNDQVTPAQLLQIAAEDVATWAPESAPNAAIVLLVAKTGARMVVSTYRANVTWNEELAIYGLKQFEQLRDGAE